MAVRYFAKNIIQWHHDNPRPLPWTGGVRNPYSIWLSEIIMQQTRIEQGASYYLKFINAYPTVNDLANASYDDVMKLWQGLGYYTRARNLHKAAQHIAFELDGLFPSEYNALLSLPGIGPYSAAAISSFAFGHPHAVVDGNVKRVVARYFGIAEPIDSPAVHEEIRQIAQKEMKGSNPADFNQAIMNFGALICKPKPLCEICPLGPKCYALRHNLTDQLPVRIKKKEAKTRHFHFIVLHYKNKVLLQQRLQKDIWKGLYAPPIIETNSSRLPGPEKVKSLIREMTGHHQFGKISSSDVFTQKLTHQTIMARFHHITLNNVSAKDLDYAVWVSNKTVHDLGKPRIVVQLLDEVFATKRMTGTSVK